MYIIQKVKEGVKYGDEIYTTGTYIVMLIDPDGRKWLAVPYGFELIDTAIDTIVKLNGK